MDFDYLRNFYELVLAGSVRKLSEIKGIPIGTISRQLSTLERSLGHTLLERKQGIAGLKLTREGKVLFDALPSVLGAFDSAKMMMESDPNLNKGKLTIYTTTSLIEDWLVPMLPSFFELYPSIHLNLMSQDTLLSNEMRDRVISIVPKCEEMEGIIQVPLLDFHVGLWASSDYLERCGRPKTMADLMRHRLIIYAKDLDQMTYPNVNWHLKNLDIKLEDLLCIHSTSARIKAAKNGLGIISLSTEAIYASGTSLERVLPNIEGPVVTMCFTYPSYLKENKLIKNTEEFLQTSFPLYFEKIKTFQPFFTKK
jgi:DNA-binding transcriptional LysR family regulator